MKKAIIKERTQQEKGGGTLTLSELRITSSKEFHVNKDSSLYRFILDGVFILWLGNIYLNRGMPKQVQKLFSVIQKEVPDNEMKNLILIGDFNINLAEKSPKLILMQNLCKQFRLKIHETNEGTRGAAKLDYMICGSGIEVNSQEVYPSSSDHESNSIKQSFS